MIAGALAALCAALNRLDGALPVGRMTRPLERLLDSALSGRPRPAKARLRCGHEMHVDLGDLGGRRLYLTGRYHPRVEEVMRRIVRRGDHVLDLGANLGFFTLFLRRIVGPRGLVTAFEASPSIARLLERNVRANRLRNVRIVPAAVLDRAGEVPFTTATADHLGVSSLRPLGPAAASRELVPGVAIDDLLAELPRVRLAKLDLEGAELLALRGMRALIERDRPALVVEVTDSFLRELGGSEAELLALLDERGYECARIGWRGLGPLAGPLLTQYDLLALPESERS